MRTARTLTGGVNKWWNNWLKMLKKKGGKGEKNAKKNWKKNWVGVSPWQGVSLAGRSPWQGVSLVGGLLGSGVSLAGGLLGRGSPWQGGLLGGGLLGWGSPWQGVSLAEGSPWWGSPWQGVSLAGVSLGVMWPARHAGKPAPSPVNRMTNRCKNIFLPQTSFAGGNKTVLFPLLNRSGIPCRTLMSRFKLISLRLSVQA